MLDGGHKSEAPVSGICSTDNCEWRQDRLPHGLRLFTHREHVSGLYGDPAQMSSSGLKRDRWTVYSAWLFHGWKISLWECGAVHSGSSSAGSEMCCETAVLVPKPNFEHHACCERQHSGQLYLICVLCILFKLCLYCCLLADHQSCNWATHF